MAAKLNQEEEADEFSQDLASIQIKVENEAHMYAEMSQEGKRKCLDDLENTIWTLRKIERNLKGAEEVSPAKNVVQVLIGGHKSWSITKQDVMDSFRRLDHRKAPPNVISVETQENFTLDQNKNLQPNHMCFIRFSTEEEASFALGLNKIDMRVNNGSGKFGYMVEFVQPTQTMETLATFRRIGNMLTRLEEIQKELKKIGAIRRSGGMPVLKEEFVDKTHYATQLEKFKKVRSAGLFLQKNDHDLLCMTKPVDTEALKKHIKTLYDEECDILIELREYQLKGVDFNFNH